MAEILICDDDSLVHASVKHALRGRFNCRSAYNTDEAQVILKSHRVDIVLLDVQMRTPTEGLDFIPRLREFAPEAQIIMNSGLTDFETVREAMRRGASDYVPKDFGAEELQHALTRALETRKLRLQVEQLATEAQRADKRQHALIGSSPAMTALRKMIDKLRSSQASVLVTGETGTGKEVVARQLRVEGAPFVAIDSATIQGSMAESILFGHEKGAFTGADQARRGLFEDAHGGIVYFDEIGNMPLEIQAKLLRVLQEKEIVRLGSTRPIPLDFRVVAATNLNLEEMAARGAFKPDLLQRLNVIPVELPPLRSRTEDIPALVEHFVARQGARLRFTEEALTALTHYGWPGNIRELANTVAYVLTLADGPEIDVADLPPRVRQSAPANAASKKPGGHSDATTPNPSPDEAASTFYDQVAAFERKVLAEAYTRLGGNVSKTALELGMDRSHLHSKLKEHGIHKTRA